MSSDLGCAAEIFNLFFNRPHFTGSLKPRPSTPGGNQPDPWSENNGYLYNKYRTGNPISGLGGVLGFPTSAGCEFGACGGGMGFQQATDPLSTNHGVGYTVASISELFGSGFPFADWTDTNHRLFGTHYCGPGGGGSSTGQPADPLCQAHDTCLDQSHLTWEDETKRLPKKVGDQMQRCNQSLCNAAAKVRTPSTMAINAFFHVYGNYTCH